jgi:hypothetical protein
MARAVDQSRAGRSQVAALVTVRGLMLPCPATVALTVQHAHSNTFVKMSDAAGN